MNRFYILLLTLFFASKGYTQVSTWTGAANNGSWTSSQNWDNGVPTASTIAVFNSGSSCQIANIPQGTIGGLRISHNTQVSFNATSPGVMNIAYSANSAVADLFIESDGSSSLTIGSSITIQLGSGARAFIGGDLHLRSGSSFYLNETAVYCSVTGRIINEGVISSERDALDFRELSIYDHARTGGEIPAANWERTSTCRITGITNQGVSGLNQVFGNYEWNCGGQQAGAGLGIMIPSDIRGNLVINKTGSGSANYIQFPQGNVRIEGDLLLNEGIALINSGTTSINLAGDFFMSGGTIRSNAVAGNAVLNINFTGTGIQHFHKTGGSLERNASNGYTAIQTVAIRSQASVDFGESVLNGNTNFVMESGATLMTGHPQGISATGNTGSVQVSGSRSFHALGGFAYTGNSAQVTGSGLPANVHRLMISNRAGVDSNGGVELTNPTLVTGELYLVSGFLQTKADKVLTLNDGAVATVAGNSFVAGPVRKIGQTPFKFPTGWIGASGGYVPIEVYKLDGHATLQAEYRRATATSVGTTIKMPLHHVSYCEYWELSAVEGNPTVGVAIYWNSHSNCNPVSYISNLSTLRVSKLAEGTVKAWSDMGNAGGNLADGYVQSENNISLSGNGQFFALGSVSAANNSLPVFFDNVVAYEQDGSVRVKWSNLTERDVAMYFVERSMNGKDYAIIGQFLPKSNRDDQASYEQLDEAPEEGSNFYRIKVLERASSKIIFSKIMRVDIGTKKQLSIYPNPVTGNQLSIGLSGIKPGNYYLKLLNLNGQSVYQNQVLAVGTGISQSFTLPASMRPGMYRLIIHSDVYQQSKLILIQ